MRYSSFSYGVNESNFPLCMLLPNGQGEEADILEDEFEKARGHYNIPFSRRLDNPVKRFFELKTKWKNDTIMSSSIYEISMHPAYQRIIGMGKEAIPLILEELSKNAGHWFWALKSITDEDPVLPEQRGNIKKMTNAWLKWGKERGYI